MNPQRVPYSLRIPPDLKTWIDSKATENGRSLNQEIVQRLKESKAKEEEGKNAQHQ